VIQAVIARDKPLPCRPFSYLNWHWYSVDVKGRQEVMYKLTFLFQPNLADSAQFPEAFPVP